MKPSKRFMLLYKAQQGKARPLWEMKCKTYSRIDRRNEPVEAYLHQMQDEDDEARKAEEWIEAQERFVYSFLCDELDIPASERNP